ncbi:MAG TPA: MMPL family transporter [Deinococcales bacterium]|nr:MMPL family transporter [Deinococcales bacterium]
MFNRLGPFLARHPVAVLLAWVLVAAVSIPFAQLAPRRLTADTGSIPTSEAALVSNIVKNRFGQQITDSTLMVTESSVSPDDPAWRSRYDALTAQLKDVPGVTALTRFDSPSPLDLSGTVQGKHVTATVMNTRLDSTVHILDHLRALADASNLPGTRVYVTGASAITRDFVRLSESDVKRSELSALPIIAIVLVLAFGAITAALLPLAVGVLSITTAMALLYGLTFLMPASSFAQSVITMLGLGAGIDYALLMVNRFREELQKGATPREAAATTTRTAGRAVAFSGLTVGIAMSALLIPPLTFVRSMGLGGVTVILITVAASVTAVPAMLALLGDRVNSPRGLKIPHLARHDTPFWGHWAHAVMRHPWLLGGSVILLMLFIASPARDLKLGYTGAFGLAPGVESRRGLELIRPLSLGGSLDTFEVVVDLGRENGYDAAARARYRKLDANLKALPGVQVVVDPFLTAENGSGGAGGGLTDLVGLIQRSISGDRRFLRASVIPSQPIHAPDIAGWESRLRQAALNAGFDTVHLGGGPVGSKEFTDALTGAIPLAVGLVFAATFLLLASAFRSLVVPVKSILMNSLTVAATYGIIVSVFQHGFLGSVIGVPTDVGAIDSSLPLIMFAVTFGLSMDYEIFLLTRVQEAHLSGLPNKEAVGLGVERTAGVITSAALIMLIVFAAFVQGQVVANKTIGFGLAAAVFLDATLVRLVLVPSILVLAGNWNWWLPRPLARLLPQVKLEH